MQMDSADTASQIAFAGIRFTLAGLLVLAFTSIREKKVMFPDKEVLKYVIPVCLAQTVGQYFFFYIGVANTSGVKGGIITGLGNFITKISRLHTGICRSCCDQYHGKFSGHGI